jgi:hypothetical protein
MKLRVLLLASILACVASLKNSTARPSSKQTRENRTPSRKTAIRKNMVEFDLNFDFSVLGETRRISLTVVLPKTIPGRQEIIDTKYSLKPTRIFEKNGNRYAEFILSKPQKHISIDISIEAELLRYDLHTSKKNRQQNILENSKIADFLKQEQYIEKDHTEIQQVANSIEGQTEEEIVKNIYDYVINNMKYTKHGRKEWGAVQALRKGRGDCSEYSDLFVAICRAKNIPARVITGYTVPPGSTSQKHNWVEVYFQDYGWVPFEPSIDKIENIVLLNRAFSKMAPMYIYFSNIRNDEILRNYHFASCKYWGDKVTMKDSIKVRKTAPTNSK